MTFSPARVATGAVQARALEIGGPFPVIEASHENTTGSNPLTITQPTGTVTGDLLVCLINRDWCSGGGCTPQFVFPSELTVVYDHAYGSGFQGNADAIAYRIIEDGDTTWAITITGTDNAESWTFRISGHDPDNPVVASAFNTDTGTDTITFPGIVCPRSNCLLLHNPCCSDGLSGSGFSSSDPGVTELHDSGHGSGTTATQHAIAWEHFAIGGGTGVRTWVPGASGTERRGGGWCAVQPVLGELSFLELEAAADAILFEDASGKLALEG